MSFFKKNKLPKECKELLNIFKPAKRYRHLELIGSGGLAEISISFDSHLNRVVAIKKLDPKNEEDAIKLQSFINEAKLISYLDHPGVISIYDTFLDEEGHLCYSMKYIEGEDLNVFSSGLHAKESPTTLASCMPVFVKMCETLAFVHDKGVIHLDLKPENIMVGQYGEVAIMDWGNAKLFNVHYYKSYLRLFMSQDQIGGLESKEDFIAGTPEFMSPEQTFLAREKLTPASDIFSVGVIFYQMLTQQRPFQDPDVDILFEKIRTEEPRAVHEINPEIPLRLSQICSKMLAKSLEQRYQTFQEVLVDIQELAISGQGFLIRNYEADELIFKEGDSGEYAFTILSGLVEISKEVEGKRQVLAKLGKDESVGELAIFTGQPRSASARTLEKTTIRLMNQTTLDEELEKLSPWLGQMITRLSKRFVSLTERVINLEKKVAEQEKKEKKS